MTSKYIKNCGIYIERDYSIIIYISPYLTKETFDIIYKDVKDVIGEGIRIFPIKASGICPYDNQLKISLEKYMDINLLFWDIYSKLIKDKRITVVPTTLKKPTRSNKPKQSK